MTRTRRQAACRHRVRLLLRGVSGRRIIHRICARCDAQISLGPSNDDFAAFPYELQLADWIADVFRLWEPSAWRTKLLADGIANHAARLREGRGE